MPTAHKPNFITTIMTMKRRRNMSIITISMKRRSITTIITIIITMKERRSSMG